MLRLCQFLILLVSVAIMVYCSPHGGGHGHSHSHHVPAKPKTQDTVFPGGDFGEGGDTVVHGESSAISSRIGPSNSDSDSDRSSDGSNPTSNLDEEMDSNPNLDEEMDSNNSSEGSSSSTSSTKENNAESVSSQTTSTAQDNKPIQTPPTATNGTKPGRQEGCTERPNPGECRGAFPRYYFNEAKDQCDCFLFGGCDEEGVTYTWLTLTECHDACVPTNMEKGPGCQRVSLDEVTRFLAESNEPKVVPVNNSDAVKEDNNVAEDTNDTKDTSVVQDNSKGKLDLTEKPVKDSINEISQKQLNSNNAPQGPQ